MRSTFRFDKQSHVTEIVNVWRHNQLLLLSLNSRSTCFGSMIKFLPLIVLGVDRIEFHERVKIMPLLFANISISSKNI